jgi:hypothetical protein
LWRLDDRSGRRVVLRDRSATGLPRCSRLTGPFAGIAFRPPRAIIIRCRKEVKMANPQTTKRGQDSTDRPETEEQAPWLRTVASEAEQISKTAADATQATVGQATDQVTHSAEAIAEAARAAAERSREAVNFGLRTMAGLQEPLAGVGFEQTRRVTEATVRMTEAYRDASERSAGDVQAMVAAFTSLGRGMQQWQQTWLELLRESLGHAESKRHELVGATSMAALAETQRDLYLDTVGRMVSANTTLLQLAGQIVQDAARPLQERARHAAVS